MKVLVSYCLLLTLFAHAWQEPKRITKTISMDDAMIIREVGAVVAKQNEKLIIDVVLGNTGQQSADIEKGDEILMANGKKVSSLKDLRTLYDKATVGTEFKIGLKRGERLQIAAFIKKSDDELNASGGGMVMKLERNNGDEVLPALGLMFATKGKNVVVSGTLPTASRNFTSLEPEKGDVLVSINGTPVTTAEQFVDAYDALNEGDHVTIVLSRGGKETTQSFKKPKPMGRMMMMTK